MAKAAAKKDDEKKKKTSDNPFAPLIGEDSTAAQRKATISNLIASINGEKKYKVIAPADEVMNPYFLRRPSGILQLDIDTGGGLPAGGTSMISGPDNTGKSFLLYKYCAMHQRLYGHQAAIAIAPIEGAPDYFFMRKCGFMVAIPDKMIDERNEQRKAMGWPPFTKEERAELRRQVGTVVILAGQDGQDVLDAVLECVHRNVFGIIGIDSFTALLPSQQAEQNSLHDKGQRASHATLATDFFQRLYPFLLGMWGRNETTIICTQQVRANAAKANAMPHMQKYIRDWAPAGSYAARHGKMIDLLLWNGEKIRATKKAEGESGEVLGKHVQWETQKGKAGTHDNIRGETKFFYADLTHDLEDIVTVGYYYKAIIEDGTGFLSLVSSRTGEIVPNWKKIAGVDRFVEKMAEDPANELFVRLEILAHAGIECVFR